jgi:hypothetical protein
MLSAGKIGLRNTINEKRGECSGLCNAESIIISDFALYREQRVKFE